MSKSPEDSILIARIVNAQTDALSQLYDRYGRLVFSLVMHITDDEALAEEITQDVFLQVWEKASSYQPEHAKVLTWLISVARNRAIDIYRRRSSRPEGHRVLLDDQLWSNLEDAPAVESSVEIRQTQLRVRHALSQLPDEQKKVLGLAYFQGMTHQEISEVLKEPLGTIKTRIRLGMQKLRDILNSDLES